MASGTVGYTDTRGNKDYSSIIANQIGKRLKEASNMAASERAYAAGMAEAGGTSLEEAGIGKGYFFGRALGSRFGGDRIARTRGRMGASGPGTNPAASYKQRFRGGFDYKVENNVITDTAPLSAAVVTGLRGVESGLVAVSQGLAIQGREIGKLSNVTADMARTTMLNGYLFQMFASQQRAEQGRRSARREEASIERGTGGGGGIIGGSSFGGAGGGRGMINITPSGGSSGSRGYGGGAAALGGLGGGAMFGNFGVGDAASAYTSYAFRNPTGVLGRGSAQGAGGLIQKVAGGPLAGDIAMEMNAQVIGKNVGSAVGESQFFGKQLARILETTSRTGGKEGVKAVDRVAATLDAMAKNGTLTGDQAATMKRVYTGNAFGKKEGKIMSEVQDAITRSDRFVKFKNLGKDGLEKMAKNDPKRYQILLDNYRDVMRNRDTFLALTDSKGRKLYNKRQANMFAEIGLSPGAENRAAFDAVSGVFGANPRVKGLGVLKAGDSPAGLVESYMKHFGDSSFRSADEFAAMVLFGREMARTKNQTKAIRYVRGAMGKKAADDLLLGGIEQGMKSTKFAELFGKYAGKTGKAGILKRIPVIGAIAGTVFAVQRALEGDFKGASLELASGLMGLTPKLSGAGMTLDAYLLARDLGVVPMNTGGNMSGFPTNSLISVNGMPVATFNEPQNPESIQIVRDDKNTPIEQGKGIVEGMLKKKNDYAALTSMGVERGLQTLDSQGFFSGLFNTAKNVGNNLTNPFKGLLNMGSDAKNWFMKGFTPGESSMSWKDLLSNDWMQRQRTQGAGKGMWNPFRGMPGYGKLTSGGEIPGGFQTGPTPAARQAFLRGFALLTNPKAFILGSLMTPTALGDGTLTGNIDYLNSLGIDTSNLQPGSGMGATNATVTNIYNTTNNNGSSNNDNGNEILGQGFNADLEKFITNFSIMSK